jgi:4-amino-4-deoxy-L-arabinose transferase-like glycosyltransferase
MSPTEPSVLDYIKALLSFGRQKVPAVPAVSATRSRPQVARARVSRTAPPQARAAAQPIPWRVALAFTAFLIGQTFLPPDSGLLPVGLVLIAVGAALTIWAAYEGEWRLPQIEKSTQNKKALSFRRGPLVLGLVFFGLTFLLSGGNRFTFLNVIFWILSVVLVLAAFWQIQRTPLDIWNEWRSRLAAKDWQFSISRWALVLIAAFAVIAFFRFSQLDALPAEMTSDHAEKLLDVNDILHGQSPIYFERNTGREPLQFYLTAAVAEIFGTGISFLSLKLVAVTIAFISLIYVYLLGKELGGRWVGLIALLLVGLAFWPNLLARTGLRFSLYPAFAAPTLYYLILGLRRGQLNDYLLSGIFMGIGLNGYSAFRIMPIVAGAALVIFLLHKPTAELRKRSLIGFALLALVALVICTPLVRYAVQHPATFNQRIATRMFEAEREYPASPLLILPMNVWNGLKMFNYSAGNIWLVGLRDAPAFDTVSAALLLLGAILVGIRYARTRAWLDLFLLLAIPLMMLPSTLSLAFPEENPAMNRASGAWIPAFLVCALALDAFLHGMRDKLGGNLGLRVAQVGGVIVLSVFALLNYNLFFGEYIRVYDESSWNTSELGKVIADYATSFGNLDSAWVVAHAHWVDTRLVAMNAGDPTRNFEIWPEELSATLATPAPKLFLVKTDDQLGLDTLEQLYPQGLVTIHQSRVEGKDFLTFFVPSQEVNQ